MRSDAKSDGQKTQVRCRPASLTDYLDSENHDSTAEFRQLTAPSHPKADASPQPRQRTAPSASYSDRSVGDDADPDQHTQET